MSEKDGIECPKCGSTNTEYMGEKGNNGPVEWACYSGGHFFRRKDLKETSQNIEKANIYEQNNGLRGIE